MNGPRSVVVSGDADGLEEWGAGWREQGRRTKRLRVSHAFHSPLMEPMLAELREVAEGVEYAPARIPIVSNVTGRLAADGELASGDYWVRHVREAVRFAEGVESLRAAGVTRFLELGPDGVLAAMVQRVPGSARPRTSALLAAALHGERPEAQALLACLARAHCAGVRVDWRALFAGRGAQAGGSADLRVPARAPLAGGAGGRRRSGRGGVARRRASTARGRGEVGGRSRRVAFTGRVSIESQPWVGDHVVLDTVVVPGTAFVELALAAGAEVGCETVAELTFQAPLVLEGRDASELQLLVEAEDESGRRAFTIHSRPQEGAVVEDDSVPAEWTCHASGVLASESADVERGRAAGGEAWPPAGAEPVDVEELYDRLSAVGFAYGPAFMGIRAAWRRGEELFTEVAARAPARRGGRALRRPPRAVRRGAAGRCGHPAGRRGGGAGRGAEQCLFSLSGVRRYASGVVCAAGMGDLRRGVGVERGGARRAWRSGRVGRFAGRTAGGGGAARGRGPAGARQLVQPGVGGAARSHR